MSETVAGNDMASCPQCGSEAVPADAVSCPACGTSRTPDTDATTPAFDLHELDGLDLGFLQSLRDMPRRPGWQARITAGLLSLVNQELQDHIRQLPTPQHGGGFWPRKKQWLAKLDDCFQGSLMAINGCQHVLRTDLPKALSAADLAPLRNFHDQMLDEVMHLQRFSEETAALVFPDGSNFARLQSMLLTWGSELANRFDDFIPRLRQTDRLRAGPKPPQISLAPVTLSRFYRLYEGLH